MCMHTHVYKIIVIMYVFCMPVRVPSKVSALDNGWSVVVLVISTFSLFVCVYVYSCVCAHLLVCVYMLVYMCVCVCVWSDKFVDELTDLKRRLGNCPGWKGVSKCLGGPQDRDGDVYQLSAFKLWHHQ